MKELDVEQGSEQWKLLRRHYITGTRFHNIVNGGEKAWLTIRDELENGSSFTGNAATAWGTKHESEAIALFSLLNNMDVRKCGFIISDECDAIGASPDGLIRDYSGIEVKCPYRQENHTEVRLSQQMPRKYVAQVQGMLMISKYDYWWFVSYDPRETPVNRLVAIKITRDESYIKNLYERCKLFLEWWKGDRELESIFTKANMLNGDVPKLF